MRSLIYSFFHIPVSWFSVKASRNQILIFQILFLLKGIEPISPILKTKGRKKQAGSATELWGRISLIFHFSSPQLLCQSDSHMEKRTKKISLKGLCHQFLPRYEVLIRWVHVCGCHQPLSLRGGSLAFAPAPAGTGGTVAMQSLPQIVRSTI